MSAPFFHSCDSEPQFLHVHHNLHASCESRRDELIRLTLIAAHAFKCKTKIMGSLQERRARKPSAADSRHGLHEWPDSSWMLRTT